ncbi:hypothetical protein D3C71_1271700 [compost metagenome]
MGLALDVLHRQNLHLMQMLKYRIQMSGLRESFLQKQYHLYFVFTDSGKFKILFNGVSEWNIVLW